MLSNACPSLKRTLMSFGATSAEMTGFTAFQLSIPKLQIASIGSMICMQFCDAG